MIIVGDVLICAVNNINVNMIVIHGISLPTGEELWSFSQRIDYYQSMGDHISVFPSENCLYLLGVKKHEEEEEEDEKTNKVRLAFLSFNPSFTELEPVED